MPVFDQHLSNHQARLLLLDQQNLTPGL